jgi:hypothetical protein
MSEPNRQIDAFTFQEPDTGEECWIGVREICGRLYLALSRLHNGDIEVQLDQATAERLARALVAQFGRAAND